MNIGAQVGDKIVVNNKALGQPPRTGEILEVLGEGDSVHYRVRWSDGHESIFYPGPTTHIVPRA